METNGVQIDANILEAQSHRLTQEINDLEQTAHQLAGMPFNLGSPKQLQVLLYETFGLPILKKTPKGQPSTSEEVLEELAASYPLPKIILKHRHLSKLKSTYVDKLPKMIHRKTNRVPVSYTHLTLPTTPYV